MVGRPRRISLIRMTDTKCFRFCSWLYLFTLSILRCGVLTQNEDMSYPGIYMQADGNPSLESRLVWRGTFPVLRAVTVCTHIFPIHTRGLSMPVLSYSTGSFPDEFVIYFDFEVGYIEVICCKGEGRIHVQNILTSSLLHTWVHFCVSSDLTSEEYTLVLNSQINSGKFKTLEGNPMEISGQGNLILGQEQDTFNGGFSIEQSYEGKLANFFIFAEALDELQLIQFTECNFNVTMEPTVSFKTFEKDWKLYGSVKKIEVNEREVCTFPPKVHIAFPERRTLKDSLKFCRMLKGVIAAPENEEENTRLAQAVRNSVEQCSVGWGLFLWIGLRAEFEGKTYKYINIYSNATANFTSFRKGFDTPTATYRCVFMDTFQIGSWGVYPCDFRTCVACTFSCMTVLRLRGLCQDTLIDRQYYMYEFRNGKIALNGLTNSKIFWNKNTWMLENMLHKDIKGKIKKIEADQYPFGLHVWNITGDRCSSAMTELLLTACRADQYTCNDGTCILKMQRCDMAINCPDKSDEKNCTAVVVPDDYIKEVPPARLGTEAASVNIHLAMMSMQPINTLNMKIAFDINTTLMWRDTRLDLLSLNYVETLNVIQDGNAIWQPKFLFEDYTGSEANTAKRWETFVAVMQSGPLPDDITRVKEDEVYPGTKNSLKLTQTYHVEVSCKMQFAAFPFDAQLCSFNIRMQYFTRDLATFNASSHDVEYGGERTLREYKVESIKLDQDDANDYSRLKVVIRFDNLSGFHIISTYVPTFLMVIIAYSALYFDIADFNDRIMVSLTALLVLATLFTQISATTPRTSYLKLLDVWFVVTIFINFAIVILLVVINGMLMKESRNGSSQIAQKSQMKNYAVKSTKINKVSQVVIPAILITLVIAYIVIAVI